MERRMLAEAQVWLDRDATARWYAGAAPWGCDCGHCRNFREVVRRGLLPEWVRYELEQLDLPGEKATYVCQMYPKGEGDCYQFSYRLAGQILESPERRGDLRVWCCHEIYPYGAPEFPEPHFDLEFWADLPWVLEDAR